MKVLNYIKQIFTRRTGWIILTTILCLFVLHVIVRGSYVFYKTGKIYPKYRTTSANNLTIDNIAPWMTFEYLNTIFQLPQEYLQNTLHITDSRYPKIKLETQAKQAQLKNQQLLNKTQDAIRNYRNF